MFKVFDWLKGDLIDISFIDRLINLGVVCVYFKGDVRGVHFVRNWYRDSYLSYFNDYNDISGEYIGVYSETHIETIANRLLSFDELTERFSEERLINLRVNCINELW